MTKTRCEWDVLHFDPTKQILHEFLDVLQKTAKEVLGSEAQKVIAKRSMQKCLIASKGSLIKRAYLKDKLFNDIVLHLERELQLNGLGAPDETTLIPLNSVDTIDLEEKKEKQHRGYCFHCGRYGHYKVQCRKSKKERYYETKTKNVATNQMDAQKPKCGMCGNLQKTENCWEGAYAANNPRRKKREFTIPTNKISEQLFPTPSTQSKN